MRRINLLPEDLKPKKLINIDPFIYIVGFLYIVGLLGFSSKVYVEHMYFNSELIALKSKNAGVKRQLDDYRTKASKIRKPASTAKVEIDKVIWSDLYKELSSLIPKDSWLDYMSAERSGKGTRDIVIRGLAPTQGEVVKLFDRFENSYFFRDAILVYSTHQPTFNPELYEFEMKTKIYPEFKKPERKKKKSKRKK